MIGSQCDLISHKCSKDGERPPKVSAIEKKLVLQKLGLCECVCNERRKIKHQTQTITLSCTHDLSLTL